MEEDSLSIIWKINSMRMEKRIQPLRTYYSWNRFIEYKKHKSLMMECPSPSIKKGKGKKKKSLQKNKQVQEVRATSIFIHTKNLKIDSILSSISSQIGLSNTLISPKFSHIFVKADQIEDNYCSEKIDVEINQNETRNIHRIVKENLKAKINNSNDSIGTTKQKDDNIIVEVDETQKSKTINSQNEQQLNTEIAYSSLPVNPEVEVVYIQKIEEVRLSIMEDQITEQEKAQDLTLNAKQLRLNGKKRILYEELDMIKSLHSQKSTQLQISNDNYRTLYKAYEDMTKDYQLSMERIKYLTQRFEEAKNSGDENDGFLLNDISIEAQSEINRSKGLRQSLYQIYNQLIALNTEIVKLREEVSDLDKKITEIEQLMDKVQDELDALNPKIDTNMENTNIIANGRMLKISKRSKMRIKLKKKKKKLRKSNVQTEKTTPKTAKKVETDSTLEAQCHSVVVILY